MFNLYNGDNDAILIEAHKDTQKISPTTGTLQELESFMLEFKRFYDTYYSDSTESPLSAFNRLKPFTEGWSEPYDLEEVFDIINTGVVPFRTPTVHSSPNFGFVSG